MSFSEQDILWMHHAIRLAESAATHQEVPVGAVLILNSEIIGEGWNCPIGNCDPSAHAEMVALRQGAKQVNNYRLIQSTLYVTLEPCLMCLGALVHARVERVVFGAFDPKSGAVQSVFNLGDVGAPFNHKVTFQGGLLAEQCGNMLTQFFRERRNKIKFTYD